MEDEFQEVGAELYKQMEDQFEPFVRRVIEDQNIFPEDLEGEDRIDISRGELEDLLITVTTLTMALMMIEDKEVKLGMAKNKLN